MIRIEEELVVNNKTIDARILSSFSSVKNMHVSSFSADLTAYCKTGFSWFHYKMRYLTCQYMFFEEYSI